MASIESYTTKKGRRWSVRYRKPTGATTTKRGFTTKKSASAFAATVETRKMEGLYIDPTAGRLHLDRLWERLDRIT
jgi:hypothetical protein